MTVPFGIANGVAVSPRRLLFIGGLHRVAAYIFNDLVTLVKRVLDKRKPAKRAQYELAGHVGFVVSGQLRKRRRISSESDVTNARYSPGST